MKVGGREYPGPPICQATGTHPTPPLPPQWERGFALLFLGKIKEAADQFAWCTTLDEDDCEPYLWRCLVRPYTHIVWGRLPLNE